MDYQKVPNIISCKDLDYLSDIFNWNYGGYKSSINAVNAAEDKEIAKHLGKASKFFESSMNCVLSILEGGANE